MLSPKLCKILLFVVFLALVAESQPANNPNGRNPPRSPSNRQNANREQRSRQKQANKRQKEGEKNLPKTKQDQVIAAKGQKEQALKNKTQNKGQIQKRQNNATNKIDEKASIVLNSQANQIVQSFQSEGKEKYEFEEERHRNGDEKRQNLLKLIFLVALGLIVIVIILLVKPSCKRAQDKRPQNSNTQEQIRDNKPQVNQFQTFSQHENHFQRIVIREKETKIEIMKDRFLKKPNTQQTQNIIMFAELPIPIYDQSKVSTPTFGGYTFRAQI